MNTSPRNVLKALMMICVLSIAPVLAQSIPSIGSNVQTSTITSPMPSSDCKEPGGVIVSKNRHFYLGDTYTATDHLAKTNNGYDTLVLTNSKVLIYNPGVFNFTSPIKWKSQGIPYNSPDSETLITEGKFTVATIGQGQLVYNIYRTALSNIGTTNYTISYIGRPSNNLYSNVILANKTYKTDPAWTVSGYECVNYFVHYCGDGIKDTKASIASLEGGISYSIANEQCDDGASNGQPGKCKIDCSGIDTLPAGSLTVTKTSNKETYTVGEQVTFTISVSNPSAQPVTNIIVKDVLPAELTYVSSSDGGTHANGTITFPAFNLNAGQSKSFTLVATYTTYKASVINNVNWTAVSNGTNLNGTAQKQIYCTLPSGSLTVTKTSNKETYSVGETVLFTISVSNTSSQTVTDILLEDILPPELKYVSSDGGAPLNGKIIFPKFTLTAGQSRSFTLTAVYETYKASVINNVNWTAVSNGTNLNGTAQKQIYCTQPAGNLVVEKVLTTDKNYNVGDTVQFRINISNPSSQIVSNISIEDILPAGLEYISSSIQGVNNPVYFSTGIVQGNFKILYTGFSLNPGQNGYILINVKLYSCAATINNVIWSATSNGQTIQGYTNKKVDCTVPPISIVKTVTPTSTYLGEIVRYTITSRNSTSETLTNVSLEDVWPSCFTLVGTPTISQPATQSQNGNITKWTLSSGMPAGSTVTISFDGKASSDISCIGSHINTGRIIYTDSQGSKTATATATVTLTAKPQLTIKKTIIQQGSGPGDIVKYRITYKNAGTMPIVGYTIKDTWPTALSFESASPAPRNVGERPLVWDFSTATLQAGEEKYIEVIGKISYSENTTQIPNTACIKSSNEEICDTVVITVNQPICISLDVKKSGTKSIVATCTSAYAFGNTAWTVQCGGDGGTKNGFVPSSQNFSTVCTYSTSAIANNATVICNIAGNTNNSCRKNLASSCDISVEPNLLIIDNSTSRSVEVICSTTKDSSLQIDCGNGNKSSTQRGSRIVENCEYDEYDMETNRAETIKKITCSVDGIVDSCEDDVILSRGFLGICGNGVREGSEQCDGGGNRGEGDRRGYDCKIGCVLEGEDTAQCLSVHNGNISIEKGEYLPFWWTVYEDSFTTTSTCSSSSDKNKIIKSSMECTFELQKPGPAGQKELKQILKRPCVSTPTNKIFNFFQALIDTNTTKYAIWKYAVAPSIFNTRVDDELGEYKLRLKEITYEYCDDNLEKKESQTNNVCETNFTITKPYLVQKSAFGAFPKATDIDLSRFYDLNGNNIITRTDLSDIMVLDKNDYVSNDVDVMVNIFISKVEKLAVAIPSSKLPKYLKDMNVTVKKVPNKDIYILNGTNGVWLNLAKNITIDTSKPFTMIVKNANLVINGNINVNGMFIAKNGTIKFDNDDCSKQQIVKGIFVAKNFSAQKYANNSLDKEWCNGGGLYVKGVLIGNAIDTLVNNKRSNLSNWFKVNGTEKAIKTQRRNMIFNGASVLIEYSPDLWQNLPPGAEDFTKLLEVYKK